MSDNTQLLMRKALVVGQHFARKTELGGPALQALKEDDELTIVHDSCNEYDHYAASVLNADKVHVGFISADISPVLCLMASNGYEIHAVVGELEVNKAKNFTVCVSAILSS